MEQYKNYTLDDFEKHIKENPKDIDVKFHFANYLMLNLMPIIKENTSHKELLFKKLKEITSVMEEPDKYPFLAYIAFHSEDMDNYRINIRKHIESEYKKGKNFQSNDVGFYIINFFPSYKGMYEESALIIDSYWPGNPGVFTLLAYEKYFGDKDEDKALELLSKSIEKDKDSVFAEYLIGEIFFKDQLWKSALAHYNRVLDLFKKNNHYITAPFLFKIAWCYGKIKDFNSEEKAYRDCLKSNPDYPHALNNLGWSLMKQKKYGEALKVFDKSIKKGNDKNFPYRNKVSALKKLYRYEEALSHIEESLKSGNLGRSFIKEAEKLKKQIKEGSKQIEEEAEAEDLEQEVHVHYENETLITSTKTKTSSLSAEKLLEDELEKRIIDGHQVFNKSLKMYDTLTGYGRQFIIPGGRIDLLTQDIKTSDFYVIELKKDTGYGEVFNQLTMYIAWVKKHLAKGNQKVYGVICVNNVSDELRILSANSENILLFEYNLSFSEIH